MSRWRKPRFLFAYAMVPLLFLGSKTTEPQQRLGLALVGLGELIRLWANGYVGHVKVNVTQEGDAKIGRLITAGPYAYVRHPLYLGTFLIGAGFCLVVGNLWLSLAALASFLAIYRTKMKEEESRIGDECGEAYAAYHRAVPRWLPTFRRYAKPEGRWMWQGITASKEWKTVVWLIVVAMALYLYEEAWQEHEFLSRHKQKWIKHVVVLLIMVVLMATDGLIELIRRRAQRAAPASCQRT